jgi:hypothetical protein
LDVDFSQVVVSPVKTDRVQTDRQTERKQASKKERIRDGQLQAHTYCRCAAQTLVSFSSFFPPILFPFFWRRFVFFRFSFSLRLFFVSCIEEKKNWHEMYVEEEGEIIIVLKKGGSSRKIVEILRS